MPLGSDPQRRSDERRKRFEQPPEERNPRVEPKPVEFMPIRSFCQNCTASPKQHDNGEGCNRPKWSYRFIPKD